MEASNPFFTTHHENDHDEQAAGNFKHEIEKLLREVNELLEKIHKGDPAHKDNFKKLTQLKQLLEDSTKEKASGTNIMNFLHLGKKSNTQGNRPTQNDDHEDDKYHSMHYKKDRTGEQPQDIINMNLDDSIIQGIDGLISLYEFFGNLIGKVFKH